MSFNTPFFNFFDAINSEVDNFNRALGNYNYGDYRPRRGLPSNNRYGNRGYGNRSSSRPHGRELQRRGHNSSNYGPLTTTDWDPWFGDEDDDWGLLPGSDFGNFGAVGITPPVDLLEHDTNYELNVTVPGIRSKNSINVDYHRDSNQIEISGEVPPVVTEENRGKVKMQEVASGNFRRVLPLPKYPGVDADKIKADYSSGVLRVEIPKLAPTGPKEGVHRIEVSSQDSWNE